MTERWTACWIIATLLATATVLAACATTGPAPMLYVSAERTQTGTGFTLTGSGYTPGATVSLFIDGMPISGGVCQTVKSFGFTKAKPDRTISAYIFVSYLSGFPNQNCAPLVVARDNVANLAGAYAVGSYYWWP